MIEQITLWNFLAFREVELRARPLTLLSGTNSSGKSCVLHALAMLRQSYLASTLPQALLLDGELVELGVGRDILHSDPGDVPGSSGTSLGIELMSDGASHTWLADYEAVADVLPLSRAPAKGPVGGLFRSGFQYLKADRIVPRVIYPKSHEAVVRNRFLGASGEHAANYLRVHGEEPTSCVPARHPEAPGHDLASQTNAWLAVLSPGSSLDVADVEGTDYVRFSYQRTGPEVKTEVHRATNVGFGLTYSLPIIIACLDAASDALLLIENPEAHLHPHGQAVLGRLCAMAVAGGAQVVLETHSDHVLNAVRLAVKREELAADAVTLHFFERVDRVLQPGITTLEIGQDGMIPRWPRGFFDEWDRAVGELLD